MRRRRHGRGRPVRGALIEAKGEGGPGAGRSSLIKRLRIETHAVWLAARDPRTPLPARILGLVVAAYAFSPIDLIPDFIPVLGLLDDLILVPAGIWLFVRMLPPGLLDEHRASAAAAAERPTSRIGLLIVLTLWLAGAWLLWSVAASYYQ